MPTLILVRHGRSTANTSGVLAGRTPGVALDERGAAQAAALPGRLAELPISEVVTSPLQRCQETLRPLLEARPELRPHTGLDAPVSSYVLGQEGAEEFIDRYALALEPVLAGYVRENKRYATIAVGCTGGKHRSVAITEVLARRLAGPGVAITAVHRDLGRE
jgi:bisphosphoglycerate-dependent phosphoglycerate mutase